MIMEIELLVHPQLVEHGVSSCRQFDFIYEIKIFFQETRVEVIKISSHHNQLIGVYE